MRNPWTYHVVLGNGTDSVMEVGPIPTVGEALTFAASVMGRTALDVEADVLERAVAASPAPAPQADWRSNETETSRLIGYTIERYDGEETDGSWSIDGGLRSEIREAVAA